MRAVVSSQESTRGITNRHGLNIGTHVEAHYDVTSIFLKWDKVQKY